MIQTPGYKTDALQLIKIAAQICHGSLRPISVVRYLHLQIDQHVIVQQYIDVQYKHLTVRISTWEELKMLAEKNPIMNEAVEAIYELTADETVREQCKAREKHLKEKM